MRGADTVVALALLGLIALLDVPFLSLPNYWDGLTFLAAAQYVFDHGLSPVLPASWDTIGHPVLLAEILALAWLVFGKALWVSHALVMAFAFLTLFFTYRIGAVVYDWQTGLVAAVLLATYPLFWTQSTVLALDLPTAALTAMAAYCLLTRRRAGYLLAATAMVMVKEMGALLLPAVLIHVWLTNRGRSWRHIAASLALHSVPLFVLAGWWIWHAAATGWVLPADKTESYARFSAFLPPQLWHRDGAVFSLLAVTWSFFGKTFLLGGLTLLILGHTLPVGEVLTAWRRDRSWRSVGAALRARSVWSVWGPPEVLAVLVVPVVVALVSLTIVLQIHRYLLPIYPFFFVLAARALRGTFTTELMRAITTAAVLVVFVIGAERGTFGSQFTSPSSLTYRDIVTTHAAAVRFVETSYPGKVVLADWPEYIELSMPSQGYVERPLPFVTYAPNGTRYAERVSELGGTSFDDFSRLTLDDFDLVIVSPETPYESLFRDAVRRFDLPLLVEFHDGTASTAIYANRRTLTTRTG